MSETRNCRTLPPRPARASSSSARAIRGERARLHHAIEDAIALDGEAVDRNQILLAVVARRRVVSTEMRCLHRLDAVVGDGMSSRSPASRVERLIDLHRLHRSCCGRRGRRCSAGPCRRRSGDPPHRRRLNATPLPPRVSSAPFRLPRDAVAESFTDAVAEDLDARVATPIVARPSRSATSQSSCASSRCGSPRRDVLAADETPASSLTGPSIAPRTRAPARAPAPHAMRSAPDRRRPRVVGDDVEAFQPRSWRTVGVQVLRTGQYADLPEGF